jgi:hypothetical protein
MPLKIPHCPLCSGVCELKRLSAVSGEDGTLKLTLRDLPVFQCPKNHKGPVHRDFMIWLIREIRERETRIAAGKEQGLLFKKHLCDGCGKELGAKPDRRHAYPYDLQFEDLAPFQLEIEMPLYKCPGCGKEQIRSAKELHGHVPAAIVAINDAAGFPHSG